MVLKSTLISDILVVVYVKSNTNWNITICNEVYVLMWCHPCNPKFLEPMWCHICYPFLFQVNPISEEWFLHLRKIVDRHAFILSLRQTY